MKCRPYIKLLRNFIWVWDDANTESRFYYGKWRSYAEIFKRYFKLLFNMCIKLKIWRSVITINCFRRSLWFLQSSHSSDSDTKTFSFHKSKYVWVHSHMHTRRVRVYSVNVVETSKQWSNVNHKTKQIIRCNM